MLQNVNFSYRTNPEPIISMCNAKHDFILISQGRYQSVQEYCEIFIALKEVNESLKNSIHDNLGLIEIILKENRKTVSSLSDAKEKEYMKQEQKCMMAMQFLIEADKHEFGDAIKDLKNMYLIDLNNQYPQTLHTCTCCSRIGRRIKTRKRVLIVLY